LYDLPAEEKKHIKQVPSSLGEVLDALEADHEFLFAGDVFTPGLLEQYISYKRLNEVDEIRLRPTPHEFTLYFDC
jgi:glutamine synthetase